MFSGRSVSAARGSQAADVIAQNITRTIRVAEAGIKLRRHRYERAHVCVSSPRERVISGAISYQIQKKKLSCRRTESSTRAATVKTPTGRRHVSAEFNA